MPAPVRNRDRLIGIGEPVLPRYERIAFEKALVAPQGQPLAAFVCPGHPLLDAAHRPHARAPPRPAASAARCWWTSATRARSRACSSTWSTPSRTPSLTRAGERRVVSKRMLYVELDADGDDAPPALRALPRLPAAGRGRAGRRRDPRPARVRLDHPRAGAEGAGPRHRARRAGAPGRGARPRKLALDRQDRGGGQGPAHQGDHLLGPPRRAAQAPGAGRQAERPAQLAARRASAPTTCRRGCRSGWRS